MSQNVTLPAIISASGPWPASGPVESFDYTTATRRDELRLSRPQPRPCTRWTSAGKRPQKSHFVSLFGPLGVIPTCRDPIRKSLHAKQTGPDT
jgi:hypothetical protein